MGELHGSQSIRHAGYGVPCPPVLCEPKTLVKEKVWFGLVVPVQPGL